MKKYWLLLPALIAPLAGCSTNAALVAGAAAVLYYASDGVVWRTESERISKDKYRITVRKNTIPFSGGEGQAQQIFKRRAEEVASEDGCKSFAVLEYGESLDSTTLINQRIHEGIIQCHKEPSA